MAYFWDKILSFAGRDDLLAENTNLSVEGLIQFFYLFD